VDFPRPARDRTPEGYPRLAYDESGGQAHIPRDIGEESHERFMVGLIRQLDPSRIEPAVSHGICHSLNPSHGYGGVYVDGREYEDDLPAFPGERIVPAFHPAVHICAELVYAGVEIPFRFQNASYVAHITVEAPVYHGYLHRLGILGGRRLRRGGKYGIHIRVRYGAFPEPSARTAPPDELPHLRRGYHRFLRIICDGFP
jgi:hypothetical protein